MELLSHPVVSVVILLGVLVFVHEAGHFLVGKAFGIAVESFSIGFGPQLISLRRKETVYRIGILPLGGYVKFYGSTRSEPVPEHIKGREFYKASLIGRIATVSAGPLANFILAIGIFTGLVMYGIQSPPAVVGQVMAGSPAENAGLEFGDRVTRIDGEEIRSWKDLSRAIESLPGESIAIEVDRNGVQVPLTIVPDTVDDSELGKQKGRIGISPLMVPNTITITDLDGPAGAAGWVTGMRVISAQLDRSEPVEIRYWPELSKIIDKAKIDPSIQTLILKAVKDEKKIGEGEKKKGASVSEPLVLSIPVDKLRGVGMEAALGFTDSQLTIEALTDKAKGLSFDLKPGDHIESWNGKEFSQLVELGQVLADYAKATASVSIIRDGLPVQKELALAPVELQKAEGKVTRYSLPVSFLGALEKPELVTEQYSNPFKALVYGFNETSYAIEMIAVSVAGLFTGQMPLNALGGPIAIAKVASDSAKLGLQTFLFSMAWLSVNLGLLNLFPIPVLDGGQLVLLFAEGVKRRPISEVVVENYQKIGFVMVLALIIMATYNDLGRFWANMVKSMEAMF